jgi:hypothetical protein
VGRGLYRGVYSSLPDEPDFQRLSPNARLTFLIARVCAQAGPAAIFRYYPELLMAQTGLRYQAVETSLQELERENWIYREGVVLWIRNGLRHDPSMRLSNPKHLKSVVRALEALPRLPIVLRFCDYYEIAYPFEGVSGVGPPSPIPIQSPKKKKPETEVLALVAPDGFDQFWEAYPKARRQNKADARKEWTALAPDVSLVERVLAALEAQKANPRLAKEDFAYFPHAHRWLRKRRWEDELPDRVVTKHDMTGLLTFAAKGVAP